MKFVLGLITLNNSFAMILYLYDHFAKQKRTLASFICFTIFFLCLCSPLAFAQRDSSYTSLGLYELSLEDLSEVTVTSASKKVEGTFEAPSIMEIVTAEDIRRFGGNNLLDVLQRATHFMNLSSMSFRQSTVGLRGDLSDELNAHILFMINGRPFRDSNKSGLNAALLTSFPLSAIEKIEIIRGPGSVVHGTNAYIGVVNIITNTANDDYFEIQLKGGSFSTGNGSINFGNNFKGLQVNGGINYLSTAGWQFSDSVAAFNIPQTSFVKHTTTNLSEEAFGANLSLAYKNFSLNTFFGRNEMMNVVAWHPNDQFPYRAQRTWVDLGWGDSLGTNYILNVNATYNSTRDEFRMNVPGVESEVNEIYADDYLIEVTNFYSLNDQVSLVFGGTVNFLSGSEEITHTANGENYFSAEPYSRTWWRGYVQADYKPRKWLKFVVGGQINKVPNISLNFVPRIAAILNTELGFGAKLMYGQAFRSPNAAENGLIGPIFVDPRPVFGDPNLTPELIETIETQVFMAGSRGRVSLSFFNSSQKDIITRAPFYANANNLTTSGAELEGKYHPNKKIHLTGSFAIQKSSNDQGHEDVYALPRAMFKFGACYRPVNYLDLSIFNSYYSGSVDNEYTNVLNSGYSLNGYNWLTAKVNIQLDKAVDFIKNKQVYIALEGVNLFNVDAYNPSFFIGTDRNIVRTLPQRAFYGSLGFKF